MQWASAGTDHNERGVDLIKLVRLMIDFVGRD
jgi:hypothetical protein